MACADCTKRNPATPPYSKAKPVSNPACVGCGCNGHNIPIIPGPGADSKPIIMLAGPGIVVENLSDANTWRFRHSVVQVNPLEVGMSLIAKETGVTKTSPVLRGTVIDEVQLSWAYNKAITIQTLTNTGGLVPPALLPSTTDHSYSGENITNNISFTIQGNDGLGQPGSVDADTETIAFGNNGYWGKSTSKINQPTSSLSALLATFSKQVKTVRNANLFATGTTNEHFLYIYPKAFGLATFTKGIFVGGYVRLKNVAGTLKSELALGDVESDIMLTNEKGHTEAFYVYQSLFDNQNDPVTPLNVT